MVDKELPYGDCAPLKRMFLITTKNVMPQPKRKCSDNLSDFLKRALEKNPEERISLLEMAQHPFIAHHMPQFGEISFLEKLEIAQADININREIIEILHVKPIKLTPTKISRVIPKSPECLRCQKNCTKDTTYTKK